MTTRLIQFGGRPVLLFHSEARHYGRFAIELLLSLIEARDRKASLFILTGSPVVPDGLLQLDSPDVQVLRPGGLRRAALKARWNVGEVSHRVLSWPGGVAYAVRDELAIELRRYVSAQNSRPEVRAVLRRWQNSLKSANATNDSRWSPIYSRHLLRQRVPVRLSDAVLPSVRKSAEAHGIAPEAPLVTIHASEGGTPSEIGERKLNARDDTARNAQIASYFQAVDALVALGYTVVRIGDASMTPVSRPGLIDLATSPSRTSALEVHCLLRSTFLLSGEGGPPLAAHVTNTPTLLVNVTDPLASYPIRDDGLFIMKRVIERETDRPIDIDELLSVEYQRSLRNTTRYAYYSNSPEEIAEAVREMLAGLKQGWRETPPQQLFRKRIEDAAEAMCAHLRHVGPWRLEAGFSGTGRIGAAFLAQRWPEAWQAAS